MSTEDARKTLLEYFSSQINLHAQITATLIVAIFAQGIFTYSIPDDLTVSFLSPNNWGAWKLTFAFIGIGFIGGLAILQWGKVYWYSRLWNATLVAVENNIEKINGKKPKSILFQESPISRLFLGTTELFCKACKKHEAIGIYLSKHMKAELPFCILSGIIVGCITSWGQELKVFNIPLDALSVIVIVLFIGLISWVIITKTCDNQINEWLRSQDLERLADVVDT